MRRKLNYKEGDWFLVPLKKGGCALGRVTRMSPKGGVLFGYFFGPRMLSAPRCDELAALSYKKSVCALRFGDLNIVNGEWTVIRCEGKEWDKSKWPTPAFVRVEPISDHHWQVIYSDDDPNNVTSEQVIPKEDSIGMPKDGLFGAGAVEIVLDQLLK